MKSVWVIAKNTFREVIRDRILYGILVFALILIGLSLVLGQLSFDEQARISVNFGFAGIQLSAAIVSIFIGSSLVSKEIEKQTILTLLARPISRAQFICGKFLGLTFVVTVITMGLAAVLLLLTFSLKIEITESFFIALFGILLESMVLLSFTLFFGSFSRPIMTVMFAVSVFIIGHWVDSLPYFVSKSSNESFKVLGKVITKVVPNLEMFNWRTAPIYGDTVPYVDVAKASLYSAGWVALLFILTSIIFRRRDFV